MSDSHTLSHLFGLHRSVFVTWCFVVVNAAWIPLGIYGLPDIDERSYTMLLISSIAVIFGCLNHLLVKCCSETYGSLLLGITITLIMFGAVLYVISAFLISTDACETYGLDTTQGKTCYWYYMTSYLGYSCYQLYQLSLIVIVNRNHDNINNTIQQDDAMQAIEAPVYINSYV